jgi:hypothetical protein
VQVHGQDEYILICRLPSLFQAAKHMIADWGFNVRIAVDLVEIAEYETNMV